MVHGTLYRRKDRRATSAALGALPRLRDVLGDEERQGKRIPISPTIDAVLTAQPRINLHPWVFTDSQTEQPFKSVRQVFDRAVLRAGITTGDVTLHTLRHTALSRMIASGYDDYTVMEISGHSPPRGCSRGTHIPPNSGRFTRWNCRAWSQTGHKPKRPIRLSRNEIAELLKKNGGRQEARTPDLCVANAALSQLS